MLKEFVVITPVWGVKHIQLFLEICLPSLLAENNLPKLTQLARVKYFIYTKEEDAPLLREAFVFKQLEALLDLSLIIFDDIHPNNHSAMSWCHKHGFQYTVKHDSYAVFIPPDCIWSNQALLSMYRIVEKGYKIIHMSGIRVISNWFCEELKRNSNSVSLSSRELVKLALKYFHPITISHFFDEKEGGLMPANLFWNVDETGIIARCFHLHPLLVYGTKNKCDFKSTIDDDLALVFNANNAEEYIITDSDELIAFEMSPLSHQVLAAYRKGNIDDIAMWAQVCTNAKHRNFIKKTIKIHTGDVSSMDWVRVEKKADEVVFQTLDTLRNLNKLNVSKTLRLILYHRYTKKLLYLYNTILNEILKKFHRLMRSTRSLYPWHWNYAYHSDTCRPFINEIKHMSGTILYFDDRYFPLIHSMNDCIETRKDIKIDLMDADFVLKNKDRFSWIYKNHYDFVIVRNFDLSPINQDFLNVIQNVLRTDGRLFYFVTQHIDINQLKLHLPKEMKFVLQKNYGRIGTKILNTFYHKYHRAISSKMPFLQYNTVRRTLKVIFLPILLFFYPVMSLLVYLLNNIFISNRFWAVKRLNFYHEG